MARLCAQPAKPLILELLRIPLTHTEVVDVLDRTVRINGEQMSTIDEN
jgi:hypothetical protein